MHEELIDFRTQ